MSSHNWKGLGDVQVTLAVAVRRQVVPSRETARADGFQWESHDGGPVTPRGREGGDVHAGAAWGSEGGAGARGLAQGSSEAGAGSRVQAAPLSEVTCCHRVTLGGRAELFQPLLRPPPQASCAPRCVTYRSVWLMGNKYQPHCSRRWTPTPGNALFSVLLPCVQGAHGDSTGASGPGCAPSPVVS